jgi:hypothetical protein
MDYMRGDESIESEEGEKKILDSFCAIDEAWTILNARASQSMRNRIVSNILLRSRKRGLNYTFTTQLLSLVDKSIRKITDFTAYPMLSPSEDLCKLIIFRGSEPKPNNILRQVYFKTEGVFKLFNTREEVKVSDDTDSIEDIIVFQEDKHSTPQFFKEWKECDLVGEKFWTKNRYLINQIH